jgi:hypothetical protein
MRQATEAEFQTACAKAGYPAPRYMHAGNTQDVLYSDRGTEVAQKTILHSYGRERVHYSVNPAYL